MFVIVVCLLSSLTFSQCLFNPFFAFYGSCFVFSALVLIRVISMEGGFCLGVAVRDGVVHQCSYVITKKVQFVLTYCQFGSVSKYSSISLDISFLSLH